MLDTRSLIVSILLLVSPIARAQSLPSAVAPATPGATPSNLADVPAAPTVPTTETFSGWVLAADVAGFAGGIALATATDHGEFLALSMLGGPLVHAAYRDPGGAAGSLVLHVAAPIAGAFIGYQLRDKSGCQGVVPCGVDSAVGGWLLGAITATAVDAFFLAHRTYEAPVTPRQHALIVPTMNVAPGGLVVGVGGLL